MDEMLSTTEVARLAGVGPTAVKRWTDAGLIRCIRTVGGHRRFPRADVEVFLRGRGEEPPSGREPWVGALLDADDPIALHALLLAERSRAGAWFRVAETGARALAQIGELWAAGAVSILEEHLASERLARALARASEAIPVGRGAPRAVLACAEGDEHVLGLALVELVLREAGWATDWAGRRTPVSALPAAVARGARMLCISASAASTDAVALERQAEELGRIALASGTTLVLGGAGAWPDRPRVGFRFTALEPFHRFAVAEHDRLVAPGLS
jgi:excisionase family DNA binding protein